VMRAGRAPEDASANPVAGPAPAAGHVSAWGAGSVLDGLASPTPNPVCTARHSVSAKPGSPTRPVVTSVEPRRATSRARCTASGRDAITHDAGHLPLHAAARADGLTRPTRTNGQASPQTSEACARAREKDMRRQTKPLHALRSQFSQCQQRMHGRPGVEPEVVPEAKPADELVPDGRDSAENPDLEAQDTSRPQQPGHQMKCSDRIREVRKQVTVVDHVEASRRQPNILQTPRLDLDMKGLPDVSARSTFGSSPHTSYPSVRAPREKPFTAADLEQPPSRTTRGHPAGLERGGIRVNSAG
jgi:hypothetical protein